MKNRIWNDDEKNKVILLLKKGKNYKEISAEINRTSKAIKVFLNKNGYSYLVEQRIEKRCLNCNTGFESTVKSKKKFCNSSCAATYNNKNRKIDCSKSKKGFCFVCGKEIEINIRASKKNCKCDDCNSKKAVRNKKNRNNLKEKYRYVIEKGKCLNCNKDLKTKKGFFCDNTCSGKFKLKEKFNEIESGNTNLSEKIYKKYLIEKHGEKCMECGWNKINEYSKKIPIELEHIDGNSENNKLENLKLLCPNCHSLTPTYKGLNAGNGRYKRKKRYHEGKSF